MTYRRRRIRIQKYQGLAEPEHNSVKASPNPDTFHRLRRRPRSTLEQPSGNARFPVTGSFNPFLNSITAFNPFLNSILPSKPPKLKTSTLPTLRPSPTLNPPALGPSPASNLPALRPSPTSNLPTLGPSPTSAPPTLGPSPTSNLPALRPSTTSALPTGRGNPSSSANPPIYHPPKVQGRKKRPNPSSANPPSLKVKKQRTAEDPRTLEAVKFAIGLLEEEFEQREAASEAFPPEISSTHIRTAISKYEDEISAVSERSICCSCGSFVATGDIYKIDDEDDFMRVVVMVRTLLDTGLFKSRLGKNYHSNLSS